LQERGHHVMTAASGREALKRLAESEYAVVLTDLRMKRCKESNSSHKSDAPTRIPM
jgi:CheY-like chemotaxis protein